MKIHAIAAHAPFACVALNRYYRGFAMRFRYGVNVRPEDAERYYA